MAKSTGVGLAELTNAFAESEDTVAAESTGPASPVKSEKAPAPTPEQPNAVEPSTEEEKEVDLLSVLEENLDDEEEEQLTPPGDDSPTHVVKGEHLTTQQLIDGYMRQSDYTKKTQELSDERDRLKNAETLYNAIKDDPVGTIRQLAQRFNMGQPLLTGQGQQSQQPSQSQDIDALIEQKVQERLGSDPRLAEVTSLAERQAEETQFANIESEYGKPLTAKDREIVKAEAQKLGVSDLSFVFAALLQKAQLRQAQKEKIKQASTASGRRSDDGEAPTPKKSYEEFGDAFWDSVKELGWDE